MGIIKKYHQKVISYGLIVLGIIAFALILIVGPSRTVLKETNNYNQSAKLVNVNFPFIQQVEVPAEKLSFLEIRFGDDSINQHRYNISVTYEDEILFDQTYINEISNILRLTIDGDKLSSGKSMEIKIECQDNCEDVKLNIYDNNNEKTLSILYGFRKVDYGLLWYGLFLMVVGLTLLPLTRKYKQP